MPKPHAFLWSFPNGDIWSNPSAELGTNLMQYLGSLSHKICDWANIFSGEAEKASETQFFGISGAWRDNFFV